MSRSQRDKGARFEREIVRTINAAPCGLSARRVPLSGAVEGYEGDVIVELPNHRELKVECKCGQQVPGFFYKHLEGNDALIVRRDRQQALIVLRLSDWLED